MYDESLNKWAMPQIYKSINIYPIPLIHEKRYEKMVEILAYPKNSILEKDIVKSSYLGFIINILHQVNSDKNEKSDFHKDFIDFIEYITKSTCRIEYKYRIPEPKKITDIQYTLIFNEDIKITESDFEKIREIILEQNGIALSYINDYHPELEEKMNKINNKTSLTFEEQLFAFCDVSGLSMFQLKEYSYYQFKKHFERTSIRFEYEIFKPLESSGQIKLKDGEIKHWLAHVSKKGRYDSILIKKEEYVKKGDIFKVAK